MVIMNMKRTMMSNMEGSDTTIVWMRLFMPGMDVVAFRGLRILMVRMAETS